MQRDASTTQSAISSQLSPSAWTSSGIVDDLTPQLLEDVSIKFKDFEPLIRVRFLIACCLTPPDKKEALMPGLRHLLQLARSDDDEWVQALGFSIDPEHATLSLADTPKSEGPADIYQTVRDVVNAMDTVTIEQGDCLCPTCDTFVSQEHTCAATRRHGHFSTRANHRDIEAILLEGRPGDTCLPGIISRAAEGTSGYAALFSGLHTTVTAAPQRKQPKVASASMFAKSTASHPKPFPTVQHPSKRPKHSATSSGQHPGQHTAPASALQTAAPGAALALGTTRAAAIPTPTQAEPFSDAAATLQATRPGRPRGVAGATTAAGGEDTAHTRAEHPYSWNGQQPAHRLPPGNGTPPAVAHEQSGDEKPGPAPDAAMVSDTDELAQVEGGRGGTGGGAGSAGMAVFALGEDTGPEGQVGQQHTGDSAIQQRLCAKLSAVQASVASSDLPAIHLERADSSRHGEDG